MFTDTAVRNTKIDLLIISKRMCQYFSLRKCALMLL